MVKRKCLILACLVLYTLNSVYSSAWLLEKNSWALYSATENYVNISGAIKSDKAEIYKGLMELTRHYAELEKEKDVVRNNSGLTNESKEQRIALIDELRKEVLREFDKYYDELYYPQAHNSTLIEYGLKDYLTIGTKIFEDHGAIYSIKSRSQMGMENFARIKLFQNEKYILSVQPKILISQDDDYNEPIIATEGRLLLGFNKKSSKYNLTHFRNFEFAYKTSTNDPKDTFIGEITEGVRFKSGFYLLWQNIIEKKNVKLKTFKETLREQLSIAKTINVSRSGGKSKGRNAELTFQLGYYTTFSMIRKRRLAEGVIFSLWLKI
jgi:hypothetical protein